MCCLQPHRISILNIAELFPDFTLIFTAQQFCISKRYSVTSSQASHAWSGDLNRIYFLLSNSQVIQEIYYIFFALLTRCTLGHVVSHPPPCSNNSYILQFSKAVNIIDLPDWMHLSSIICVELLVPQLSLYLAEGSLPARQHVICSPAE